MASMTGPIGPRKTKAADCILVVDDMQNIRDIIRMMLKNSGYGNVKPAGSANLALDIILSTAIDLVISDWHMPNMTGIELLKQIKGDPKSFSIPVLMISEEWTADKIMYAVEEGTDGFLLKPFSENNLIQSISQTLANNRKKDGLGEKIIEMKRLKLSHNYRKALELGFEILNESNHPMVTLMICECLFSLEDYDRAISLLEDTDEAQRTSQHLNLLGKVYINKGQYAQGILALEQAIRINLLNHGQKIDLASAYFASGRAEDAEKLLEGIANDNPTDLNLVSMAELYLDQGNMKKAGEYLEKTVDPIPNTIPVFNNYAIALRREKRFEEAADIYRKCLRINPASDVLHFNQAILFTKINQLKEARNSLAKALELNPDNRYARELLEKISAGGPVSR